MSESDILLNSRLHRLQKKSAILFPRTSFPQIGHPLVILTIRSIGQVAEGQSSVFYRLWKKVIGREKKIKI